MRIKPTPERRNVVLDIETITLDPTDPKGALSALGGRVVCIGMLIDNGTDTHEMSIIDADEHNLVSQFWSTVRRTDVFIGHNLLEFDLPFIRQRSWILGIKPSRRIDLRRFYTADVIDTMQIWSNWGSTKHPALDRLGEVLRCGRKTGCGTDVPEWWSKGDLDAISSYCLADVRLTYLVFCRLMFLPIPERLLLAADVIAEEVSSSTQRGESAPLSVIPITS